VTPPRPLLRLEDKVRLETRRLARLGEPPPRRAVAAAWCVAVSAHAIALALPLAGSGASLPARSLPPDLPTVWRLTPPRPSEPLVARTTARAPLPEPPASETFVPRPVAFDAEPVPEPLPVLSITALPSEVETLIPEPDPSSRGLEPALVPRSASNAEPRLLRKVTPTYPPAARALAASGSVTLEVWIREDGSVEFARVTSCSRPGLGFEQSALLAVREWSYDAAPVGTGSRTVTVRTEFRRDEKRP
jgi:TonB family protein